MQQSQTLKTPFSCFRIKGTDLALLHALPSSNSEAKTEALVEGCIRRNELKLYKGNKDFYADLQIVLDHDRQHAPTHLKNHKVVVNRDGTDVLPQCLDCGKYNPIFKFCEDCQHVHYCSEGCYIRAKITHQRDCKPRVLPNIQAPLQVQVHIGSDLGHNVEVYFQHQMRMSLQMRGEKLINSLFQYFNTQGKSFIAENFSIQLLNKHFRYKMMDESKYLTTDNNFSVDSLQKLMQLYKTNPILPHIQAFLYRRGAILHKQIKQIHNNHFHLILIYLCCQ